MDVYPVRAPAESALAAIPVQYLLPYGGPLGSIAVRLWTTAPVDAFLPLVGQRNRLAATFRATGFVILGQERAELDPADGAGAFLGVASPACREVAFRRAVLLIGMACLGVKRLAAVATGLVRTRPRLALSAFRALVPDPHLSAALIRALGPVAIEVGRAAELAVSGFLHTLIVSLNPEYARIAEARCRREESLFTGPVLAPAPVTPTAAQAAFAFERLEQE